MNKLGHVVVVRVGGREYTNDIIDIDFDYFFDDKTENNTSEINLWNANPDKLGDVRVGSAIIVSAGYKGDVGVILTGKVGDFETNYHNVDREFKMYVSDGLNLWGAAINKTYEKMNADRIISDILDISGVSIGKVDLQENKFYDKLVLRGTLKDALYRLAKETNSKFFIKFGSGYFVKHDFSETSAVVLNKDTGLIGSPSKITIDITRKKAIDKKPTVKKGKKSPVKKLSKEEKQKAKDANKKIGWKVTCLLEHRINVGSFVQIESKTANGNFRVVKGSHNSNFTTEIEVLPV